MRSLTAFHNKIIDTSTLNKCKSYTKPHKWLNTYKAKSSSLSSRLNDKINSFHYITIHLITKKNEEKKTYASKWALSLVVGIQISRIAQTTWHLICVMDFCRLKILTKIIMTTKMMKDSHGELWIQWPINPI